MLREPREAFIPGESLERAERAEPERPALRERRQEIPALARRLLKALGESAIDSPRRALSPAALEVLRRYDWPGDVVELGDALRSALETCGSATTIEPEHLPEPVRSATPSLDVVTIPIGTTLEEAERALIERTLRAANGRKKTAAHVLGISRSALYSKLERLEIDLRRD